MSTDKTPGQVAYEAWRAAMAVSFSAYLPEEWGEMLPEEQAAWESAALAVSVAAYNQGVEDALVILVEMGLCCEGVTSEECKAQINCDECKIRRIRALKKEV